MLLMNTIYIIFISIVTVSFILGLFVTFFKNKKEMKIRKYNNSALKKDNYEYAKDYACDIDTFNYSDKISHQEEQKDIDCKINDNINENTNENTIVMPIVEEENDNQIFQKNSEEILSPMMYAIMDDEII